MKEQELLIYGRNPVKEALKTNRVKSIFLMDGFSFKEILDLVDKKQVRVTYLSNKEMNNMCDGVHQGVAATVKNYEYYSLESLIHVAKQQEHPVIVTLDGINDPHNFGAIMRSCDVFNATGIIISKHHQVPLNATVAKTSVGAINYVPVAIVSNINQAMDELKKEGFWIVSTDAVFNDGVHKNDDSLKLTDEIFIGEVRLMAIPKDVIELSNKIDAWMEKYSDMVDSPYTSESFGEYSYSKASGSKDSSNPTWQSVFKNELLRWKKICLY